MGEGGQVGRGIDILVGGEGRGGEVVKRWKEGWGEDKAIESRREERERERKRNVDGTEYFGLRRGSG